MSVSLESKDGDVGETVANGTWMKCVQLGRAYFGNEIPKWDGTHDDHEWTAEACGLMAMAMEMASRLEFNGHVDAEDRENLRSEDWRSWIDRSMTFMHKILMRLSAGGGVRIS